MKIGILISGRGSWPEPPIFGLIQRLGNVSDTEMFRTFNMGIGMIIICSPADSAVILEAIPRPVQLGLAIGGRKDVHIVDA